MNRERTYTKADLDYYELHGRFPDECVTPVVVDLKDNSEGCFQSWVIKIAEANGWICYHTNDSRKCVPGYPDLCLCKGNVCIMAELKNLSNQPTAEQCEWLERLEGCTVDARLWRPSDMPEIERILAERGRDE
jgi:hypothetical protein